MPDIEVKFKPGARFQLRNAPGVADFLEAMGTILRDEANATLPENQGYRMSSSRGINYPYGHWMVNVYTASDHAKRSNAVHDTLLRMLRVTY